MSASLSIFTLRISYSLQLFIVFLLTLQTPLSAQVVQPGDSMLAELDKRVEAHMSKSNIPGGLVAVVSKGEILHLRTYGFANVELAVPVSDSTVFEIGSISKQFVAATVMLLVEKNKLALDDPIHKYLAYLPSEWLGVTIRQMLTHTSGIPDYEEIRTYDAYRFRLTPEEVIRIAHSRPMDFAPGTGRYYSNTGYFLLSMIVEQVEGEPLGQILQKRIFKPLQMTQTRFADPEAIIPHRASGYWVNKVNQLINRQATETSSTLGAGGLLSSVYDLAKWDAALHGDKFLSEKSKTEMWTPAILPDGKNTEYGFGWRVAPYKGLKSQSHSGQVAGFVAYFSRFPEQEIAIIIFLNRYRVRANPIKDAVAHTFMPSLGPLPE
ncbi:MAG: class A beta-lactamase-related serine hydrolase [Calditrichaeota bacterium]|nr:MAG: class A beta-lactamase-related serine hydrolase [Calditrichota bacterium]